MQLFEHFISPTVFRAILTVDVRQLNKCTSEQIRPVLPCLVRMGLISPQDTTLQCSTMKIDILKIIAGMEVVNSIVALLSVDFHRLEVDVKREMALRQKGVALNVNDSILMGGGGSGGTAPPTTGSMALEYERSDMTRRLSLLLGELLSIQAQIRDGATDIDPSIPTTAPGPSNFVKSSDLFDNDIFTEELSDIICIALAELPTTLNVISVIDVLLHVHNGPAIICRVVANFPDCFREVYTYLIQTGEKQEETIQSTVRTTAILHLVQMHPSQALSIRSKCIELCKMPALAITLTLEHNRVSQTTTDDTSDMIAFISGLLLGNDQTIRNWLAVFIRTAQKKKGELSSCALQLLRENLLESLSVSYNSAVMTSPDPNHLDDKRVVESSALLRLYCALRGIAAIKFQEDEVSRIVRLLTMHPNPTPAGVRFVSIGLCMLIACPSLVSQTEHERRSIEWVQWLVREEAYFDRSGSFGEMLLLMAIHFHSNQLSAICDLVCSTLGMKIPIRHNNMTRMKQVFTQEIFTEQVVTAHAVKVPVTPNLNANLTGFLPIHCIHQLLKSRAFTKHNVNIKMWIYRQIRTSCSPLHPVLPALIEVYVNTILIPTNKTALSDTNKPFTEDEIRAVFTDSVFGRHFFTPQTSSSERIKGALSPQLLMLYYLLLYEDCRLNTTNRKTNIYTIEFVSEIPIKYLLYHAQKDQSSYCGLFAPLLRLLVMHFPHLTLVDDWLDEMSLETYDNRPCVNSVTAHALKLTFDTVETIGSTGPLIRTLQRLLTNEPVNIWPLADVFTHNIQTVLKTDVPRYCQDMYKEVWLRLNTVLPRRLWILTVDSLVVSSVQQLSNTDITDYPLQILMCDKRVFRCAPIYTIVLRILRATLASSKCHLMQELQNTTVTSSGGGGQILLETEREEACRSVIAKQESVIVQMLLETLLETAEDQKGQDQKWALQEVRSLVCSYLHQAFIADTMLAKLVHFQGYPEELLEVTVKGIPSMHICLDFLQELMQQNRLSTVIFAIQLLSHLSLQFALPKSLNLCVTALNLLYTLLSTLSGPERITVFKALLPALHRISCAFPALLDDVTQILLQIGRVCKSHNTMRHEHCELLDAVRQTFRQLIENNDGILKTDLYHQTI